MLRFLPNFITLLNLISGCFAIHSAIEGDVRMTIVFLSASLIFDFADGLVARALHAYSDIGKELDSLADLVSFGVAPAFLLRWMLLEAMPQNVGGWEILLVNFPFIMVAATAYRLARFNLDVEQSTVFKGLPAPANALLVVAFVQLAQKYGWMDSLYANLQVGILWGFILFQTYILVSTIPMFALKFKNYGLRGNAMRYFFIALSAVVFVFVGFGGFFPVILLYIAISLLLKAKKD